MKKYHFLLLFLFILTSCNSYITSVKVENKQEKIDDSKPMYVYYQWSDIIPDSALYLGTFRTNVTGGYDLSINGLVSSIENAVKAVGGNLIFLEDVSKNKTYNLLTKGEIYRIKDFASTDYTIDSLKNIWKTRTPEPIEGIYETDLGSFGDYYIGNKATFGVIKKDTNNYYMIYLNGYEKLNPIISLNRMRKLWKTGDVKYYLEKTEKANLFSTKKFTFNKYLEENNTLKIVDSNLRSVSKNGVEEFIRIFPEKSKYEPMIGSLTGFAIDNKRIITCTHGLSSQNINIYIRGINGDFDKKYAAIIEKKDKSNDIAIIKLKDSSVNLNALPISFLETQKTTADEIFVLGYPISSLMGEEIKLTNGIISSTTGYGGNLNSYQISAPVQPGSSGSPLFDINGNLIGMIQGGINEADNVGYALKYKYMKEFFIQNGLTINSAPVNSYKDINLSEKVKTMKDIIYIIEVNDSQPKEERKKGKYEF